MKEMEMLARKMSSRDKGYLYTCIAKQRATRKMIIDPIGPGFQLALSRGGCRTVFTRGLSDMSWLGLPRMKDRWFIPTARKYGWRCSTSHKYDEEFIHGRVSQAQIYIRRWRHREVKWNGRERMKREEKKKEDTKIMVDRYCVRPTPELRCLRLYVTLSLSRELPSPAFFAST